MSNSSQISFNIPHITGYEINYIKDVIDSKKLCGNNKYTKQCHDFFANKYGFKKCLLTTSCTDALEMAAILCGIEEGDEVIMPSYTFVSTANAFVLRGAVIKFADSAFNNPNIDDTTIENLITPKTKAIVVVHYAGFSCNMNSILALASKHNLFVVEDAAQAIDNYYIDPNGKKIPIGTLGHFAAFSFHETKNINCGEGGLLVVNDQRYVSRAEILWEKGTNRSDFMRGTVDKYNWVDVGSSFLMSELNAAFLYAQLLKIDDIQNKRKLLWDTYFSNLNNENLFSLPNKVSYSDNNAHLFYIKCMSNEIRDLIIKELKRNNIQSVFHYISLHSSPFYINKHDGRILSNSDNFSSTLLRLPLYVDLQIEDVQRICEIINNITI